MPSIDEFLDAPAVATASPIDAFLDAAAPDEERKKNPIDEFLGPEPAAPEEEASVLGELKAGRLGNAYFMATGPLNRGIAEGVGATAKGLAMVGEMTPPRMNPEFPTLEQIEAQQKFIEQRASKTAVQKRADLEANPLFQFGRQTQDWAQALPEPTSIGGKIAEEAGRFVPLVVSGPLAPFTIAMQSMGEHVDADYAALKEAGKSDEEAAQSAFDRAYVSGGAQGTIFAVLPRPLRKVFDKLLLNKIGEEGVTKFLAGRTAQLGEGATLGAGSRIAENVIGDEELGTGTLESAAGLGVLQALLPRGASAREFLKKKEGKAPPADVPPPPESKLPFGHPDNPVKFELTPEIIAERAASRETGAPLSPAAANMEPPRPGAIVDPVAVAAANEAAAGAPRLPGAKEPLLPGGIGAASAGEKLASYELRSFAERLQEDQSLALEIREGTGNRYYEPIPNKTTAEQAAAIVNERGVAQTVRDVTDPRSDLPFHVRSTMGQIALKRLNEGYRRLKDHDPAAADTLLNRSVEVAEFLEEFGTQLGQGVQSFAMWSRLSPEGQLLKFQRAVKRARDRHTAEHGDEVKEIIDAVSAPGMTQTQREIEFRRLFRTNPTAKRVKSAETRLLEAAKTGLLTEKTFYDIAADKLGLPKFDAKIAGEITRLAGEVERAPEGMPKDAAQLRLAKFMAQQTGFAPKDLPIGVYYGNILSGYNTQLVNTVDTFLNVISEINGLAIANPRAAAKIYHNALRGFLDGRADFLLTLTRGRMVTDGKWLEVPRLMEVAEFGKKGGVPIRSDSRGGRILKALAESPPAKILNAWKYVTRLMAASDAIMFRGAKEARIALLSERLAREERLRGAALDKRVEELLGRDEIKTAQYEEQARQEDFSGTAAKARVAELRDLARKVDHRADAAEFAGIATYNHEPVGFLGAMANGLGRFAESYPLMKIFVPFTRIVANVTNRGLNYTPVGFKRAWNEKAGSDARAQMLARATFGTVGLSLLGSLAAAGKIEINGAGPSDHEHRKQLENAGWKPYSIKIGDSYVSYLYSPIGLGLSIMGNMIDSQRYGELEQKDTVTRGVYAISRVGSTVFSQSFLSGLSGLFRTLSGAPGEVVSSIKNLMASTVGGLTTPTIVRDVQRLFDPKRYQSDTIMGDLLRNTPFASAVNRPALNAFGEHIEFPATRFVSHLKDDPAWRIVVKTGMRVPVPDKYTEMPDGRGGRRRITPEEYHEYLRMTGPKIKAFIEGKGDRWFTITPELAQTALSNEAAAIRQAALIRLRARALNR